MGHRGNSALEQQKKLAEEVWAVVPNGKVSEKLRVVANAMFMTCKNEGLSQKDMLDTLALLTGVAAGVMIEAAELLEEE